jgi:hypothetical protein
MANYRRITTTFCTGSLPQFQEAGLLATPRVSNLVVQLWSQTEKHPIASKQLSAANVQPIAARAFS